MYHPLPARFFFDSATKTFTIQFVRNAAPNGSTSPRITLMGLVSMPTLTSDLDTPPGVQIETSEGVNVIDGGNVGIGTTNPLRKIHLGQGTQSLGGYLDTYVYSGVVGGMVLGTTQTNGTQIDAMYITDSGNVGIGTTNPNQGNLTVYGLGADPYFTGYSEGNYAAATDFTGLAHFKSSGSHGVIRISNSADNTGSTRIDFNTTLGAYWGANTVSNSYFRGTAPAAGRIMVSGEINNNYEDSYMTFHTCRDLRVDGTGGTGNLYERMRIDSNGNVGIGTATPGMPLSVYGTSGSIGTSTRRYFNYNSSGLESVNGGAGGSIYGRNDIITSAYFISTSGTAISSDERIKKNIVDADDSECLEVLRLLKPKKYQYKDEIKSGTEPVWGFIAQEVRETLPHATQLRRDVLPNIYELANVSQSNVITFVNFNTSNLESNATTLIRTKGIDGEDHDVHLAEVIDEHSIRVEEDLSAWTGSVDETGNVVAGNQLFIYGQEVDDFVFLKKEAIWTVATSALQEVDRQLQDTKAQLASVLARLDALESA